MRRISLKNPIVKGSLILTAGGILTRLLGFVLRIFLASAIGPVGMGIYQMTLPVHGVCFSLCAAGFQTSISRFVAENASQNRHKNAFQVLFISSLPALFLSAIVSVGLYLFADILSVHLLGEADCFFLLRVMAFSLPFGTLHSCILGYYLGYQKAAVPAASQLIEQLIRVLSICFFSARFSAANPGSAVSLPPVVAMYGMVAGEVISALYCMICLLFAKHRYPSADSSVSRSALSYLRPLFSMCVPLTANRLVTSMLTGLEAILIPACLKLAGNSSEEALAVYGIFCGMSLPFIMFPITITSSISVMLMPEVSKAHASHALASLNHAIRQTIWFSFFFGILCTGALLSLGPSIGDVFFHNEQAGQFISLLAPLCTLLSLGMTLGSVLNGLGKTTHLFFHNMIAICLRVLCVLLLIPRFGIFGYLAGLILSSFINVLLHYHMIRRELSLRFSFFSWLVKPVFAVFLSIGIARVAMIWVASFIRLGSLSTLLLNSILLTVLYLFFQKYVLKEKTDP